MIKDWETDLGMEKVQSQEDAIAETLAQEVEDAKEAHFVSDRIIDANFSRSETIEIAKCSLDFLAGLAIPGVFRYLFPPVLQAAWKLLIESVAVEATEEKLALGIPRGHGKTTLTKLFVLYCILFTNTKFILVLSETGPKSENIISDVMDMLNEPNIIKLFGDWKIGIEKNTNDLKKFGFRNRTVILACLGAGGSLRGLNIKNERPDLMIFDDIQSKECSESKVQSEHLMTWLVGTAMKARSPHGCLTIFNGNMFPGPDSILKKLKKNAEWTKFISGAILADGTVLWPELRSFESLVRELNNDISMGHPEIFFSEVMNDTEIALNNKVDLSLIKVCPFSEYDIPQGKFIVIDPASGKKDGDDVSIGYFEVFDGTPVLTKVIEESLSPGNTILKTLALALETKTKCIGCEATGYQSTLNYWFIEKCKEFGISGLEFVEVHTNAISKNTRIIEVLKQLPTGEIYLHDRVKNHVINQIVNWNPLKRDNVDGTLDLLAYAPQMLQKYEYLIATDTSDSKMDAGSATVEEGQWAF